LQACRDLVNPLLDSSPMKSASPTKEFFLQSAPKSPEKSPDRDILSSLPRRPISRPQSQLSNYSDRHRTYQHPRTPSTSRRLTFGLPTSPEPDDFDEGDITVTIQNSANVTPRRTRHHKTISTTSASRPDSRLSIRSVSQQDMVENVGSDMFKRPESATGRRQSGIPTPVERRTSGIPPPRRQSGISAVARPNSPPRSTSSSSFHSDTHQNVTSPSTSVASMGAPTIFPRRQSGMQSGLPMPKSIGRKSFGSGIPVAR
jgi:hypothetical protein